MKKQTLDELGVKFGTDKSSLLHGYLKHYEDMLPKPIVVGTVVEMGLQRKDKKWSMHTLPSIRMWEQYYPDAKIYGFDKQKITSIDPRVKYYQGDQSRIYDHIRFGEMIDGDIDVLVEDCSHRPSHQLLSFIFFWPRISKYGAYIIEDCNAKVQLEYPEKHRIHSLIEPYINDEEMVHYWVPSKSAGEKSSLVIVKK